ncbi:MAG: redox-sensing transcriptional repressor Rex [Eubacteriales bacterium]|nr:redox-sensing transcriptional repressor Rex [Eubacteriales bacterium]
MAGYVSEAVIKRLPSYYRHLKELEREGVNQISSQDLGERMRLTASQIRQDINCFGGFGRQGYGYSVEGLREHIGHILGVDHLHKMIILGGGNIGRAIASSNSFPNNGFETVAIFDNDPKKIGTDVEGIIVQDICNLERFVHEHTVDIALLAVPAMRAQSLAEELYGYGVRGFWNFAPLDLKLPEDVSVENVHLDESLEVLSFRMMQQLCSPML